MPSPPIQVFLTTIASQPALRHRQEYILRILQVKKVPYTSYDMASDDNAKRLWRRKAPNDKQQLPGILVGGRFPGTFSDFEAAVENDELTTFLRLNEDWDPEIDGDGKEHKPSLPVGVPGASSPAQMRPDHKPSFAPQRSPLARRVVSNKHHPDDPRELDAGDELGDSSLTGIKVTEDDLMQLMNDLGLGGEDADELVKGLGGGSKAAPPDPVPVTPVAEPQTPTKAAPADLPSAPAPPAEPPQTPTKATPVSDSQIADEAVAKPTEEKTTTGKTDAVNANEPNAETTGTATQAPESEVD